MPGGPVHAGGRFAEGDGIAAPTYYRWKSGLVGLELSQLRKPKELEQRNNGPRKIIGDQALGIQMVTTAGQSFGGHSSHSSSATPRA